MVPDKFKGAKKPSVLWFGAPDCPVCHQTVSGALGPYNPKPATQVFAGALRYNSPYCPVHQRSNGYPAQRSTATAPCNATVHEECTQKSEQSLEAHQTVNSACPVRHRTVWCH
jgi:hypothetical protein